MAREEKVKEGEKKRGELMVEKLKRGILVGKREGNSTPSPIWKFGLIQPDGTLVPEFNFSTNPNSLSARKLGANLWEMEPQLNLRAAKISKNEPILSHHNLEEKNFGISKELDETAAAMGPSKQETSGINLRKQLAASLTQHNGRVDKAGQAQQPLSPVSYSSSMEMAPHRPAISPNSSLASNGKSGEATHSLRTSTELLKVLNRIWSLEEKHALDMSLVKALRRELDQSQVRIQELMQEKKSDQNEIDNLMKQITEYKVARKREQERIKDAVKLVEEKLEHELKLRRHSEKRHNKLAKELLDMKSLFSNALRELERERKARILLEDLCDEFAGGIRDYEQEVRFMKHKLGTDQIGMEGNDRLILHISEAWLDERRQMKLADAHDISEKQSALDKLCLEIEAFLQEKQSCNSGKNQDMSSKSPCQSNVLPHSLESFHLNEPASAPWNVNDEDDSVAISNRCPQFCRACSLKQTNDFARQQGEVTSGGHDKETTETKAENKKVQLQEDSDPSNSQMQSDEHVNERKHQLVNEGPTKSRTEDLNETSNPRMPRKGEMMQRSSREGKNKVTDAVDDTDLEDKKVRHEDNSKEGSFDPSTFAGPPNPVKKWTSQVSAADLDMSESSSRWQKSIKPNTLKAKLMEARLEGQQSRSRISKSLSQVD